MTDNAWIKAIINSSDELDFDKDASKKFDIVKINDNVYQILQNNRNYTLKVLAKNDHKSYKIQINGNIYNVELKDHLDIMVDKLGLSAKAVSKIDEIKAPMPGMVIEVLVAPGQSIQKGESLLILEAMKMEKFIKASSEGTIDQVFVQKGNPVEKNQVLIKLI